MWKKLSPVQQSTAQRTCSTRCAKWRAVVWHQPRGKLAAKQGCAAVTSILIAGWLGHAVDGISASITCACTTLYEAAGVQASYHLW
jgi:hypothetical protein